jgi:hypothetical protein
MQALEFLADPAYDSPIPYHQSFKRVTIAAQSPYFPEVF